jgi:prepilin-type N-terminal cleavage/methylation domain-containing protein
MRTERPRTRGQGPEVRGRRSEDGGRRICSRYPQLLTRYPQRGCAAFTLLELLVTVALIGILSALMAPAVQGLLGVTGPRGGMNTVSAAIEQARLSALESGRPSYVAFPLNASDEELAYSSLLVFRQGSQEDGEAELVPITRWLRLPKGVYLEVGEQQLLDYPSQGDEADPGALLPRLGGEDLKSFKVVKFDRFGKLYDNENEVVQLRLGSKVAPKEEFKGGKNNAFELTIEPLTGRTSVTDLSREGEEKEE